MITDLTSLYRDFLKSELIDIAHELSIKTSDDTTSKVLVKNVIADIEVNGVPEIEDCSDVMLEFLIAAEICDADGNLIGGEESSNDNTVSASETAEEIEEKLPDCYGFEDDRDPACGKCKVQIACKKTRIDNRPPCYGKLFDEHDESCSVCIEAPFCAIIFNQVKFDTKPVAKKGK